MDSPQQEGVPSAITDGRRIYLGNLLYSVKPEDVDALLKEHNLAKHDKIHLSFDPISARNPGYCFVEFFHKDDAEQALTALAGAELAGRPLKVGPCHAKAPSQREGGASTPRRDRTDSPVSRWGDFKRERDPASPDSRSRSQPDQNLAKVMGHYDDVAANGDRGRRLFVGGLAKMENQQQHQDEVRGYFAGYDM
jgi:RNA recognition motif-containing protein